MASSMTMSVRKTTLIAAAAAVGLVTSAFTADALKLQLKISPAVMKSRINEELSFRFSSEKVDAAISELGTDLYPSDYLEYLLKNPRAAAAAVEAPAPAPPAATGTTAQLLGMIFSAARVDDAKRAVGGFAARAKEYLLDTHEDADVEAQAPLDKEQEALQAVQVGDLAKLKSLIEDAEAEGVRIDLDALIKASFAQPHKKFGQRHLQAKIQVPIHSYLSERKADQDRRTADSQLGKQ